MKKLFWGLLAQLFFLSSTGQLVPYKNIWTNAPSHIPDHRSIDAPLMGNGDLLMSIGYIPNRLRYYLSKNDFWRLKSQYGNDITGPRLAAFLDLNFDAFSNSQFFAEQNLSDGATRLALYSRESKNSVQVKSCVSATRNLIFIELKATKEAVDVSIDLTTPFNHQALIKSGQAGNIYWVTRAFYDSVDISTEVAVAMKIAGCDRKNIVIGAGQSVLIILAVDSRFKNVKALQSVLDECNTIDGQAFKHLNVLDEAWWKNYWEKSDVQVSDTVLMKAYYQGLYTMAACSRDINFPPGIFGWNTSDLPSWSGDYHLNYNFFAPFYGLYSANRIEQAIPQDAPLIDFISRGEWYARHVTHTRGILYPVGIGPMGIETSRNPNNRKWEKAGAVEEGGVFWQQRSNAAYGLVNLTQYWRSTYDIDYGKKIYPYVMGVVNFWEDYLKFENGRYVIYNDAIHEGSGKDKNPILSLGLVRNAFELAIDLSKYLLVDKGRQAKWKNILDNLSSFPTQNRNGKKVFRYTEEGMDWNPGNGLGIQQIYPANAITLDADSELLRISRNTISEMNRWQDINTSNSFFMAAIRVGYDPDTVLKELHTYALHTYPNGFQLDNPHGIENSCTVANALNEMLCMSVGNVIRLFAGYPNGKDARFRKIRTWGAFLVSAQQKDGVIINVKIFSEKGRDCTIVNPWNGGHMTLFRNGRKSEVISGDRVTFRTSVGETIELRN